MLLPLALAAGVLTPLMATTVLSLGLVATVSSLGRPRTAVAKPTRRAVGLSETEILGALSRLHDDLQLDASQDRLWYKAEKAGWGCVGNLQACLNKQRTETLALLAQPGADMRSVARCLEDLKSEQQQLCAANRERWLSVYDALNADQKERVRLFFKTTLEQADADEPVARTGLAQSTS